MVQKESFAVNKNIWYLAGLWVYTYVKTCQIVQCKCIQLIMYEAYNSEGKTLDFNISLL